MKALDAQLSPHEEAALRKIGFGSVDSLEPAHIRRLLDLDLIESAGHEWRLTALGRQRHASLLADSRRSATVAPAT